MFVGGKPFHFSVHTKILVAAIATCLVSVCVLTYLSSSSARAATTPSLGEAESFAVLAGTYTNTSAATTINGDVGFTTGPAAHPAGVQAQYGSGSPTPQARIDTASALDTLNAFPCPAENNLGAIVDLSLVHGAVYTPGVYCSSGAMSIGTGGIVLSGAGTYVFRSVGALTTADSSVVTLSGASACDVFWTPTAATTLGATAQFAGTVIDNANAITVGANTTWSGRALSLGAGTVTTGAVSAITVPTCTTPQGTLHVVKTIVNDNGGTRTAADFGFSIDGGSATAFEVDGQNDIAIDAGTYTVTEPAVAGYTTSYSNCSGLVIASGGDGTCTITNNDIAPTLTLNKIVTTDNGGVAVASDWTLTANGGAAGTLAGPGASGSADVQSGASFQAGTYALSESAGPSGYSASAWSCVKNGGAPVTGASIVLALADAATCTITNDDVAPVLYVAKAVVNDNGGYALASAATVHVKAAGVDVAGSPQSGELAPGTLYTLSAGAYTVSEDALLGYTGTIGGDCAANGSITLALGDSKTCTVTNDDTIVATATSALTGTINVVKLVINDSGGVGEVGDFPLFLNGAPIVSGATSTFAADSARYEVTETESAGYTATFSGDCDEDGVMYLHAAEHLFCILTNDDVGAALAVLPLPPLIEVLKVPSPLTLPDGGGPVDYTYTLRNIGTVPVSGITMIGDTCEPIVLMSGDTNSDSVLDTEEVWEYTCTTTISETHTNTVVATGTANGFTATDAASATVVVGLPIEPPLIHVTKVPAPLTLPAGGGAITYAETVTNLGHVGINNVSLVDDKCTAIYVRGDENDDAVLGVDEAWEYTCSSTLTQTTTNIATATGEANGLIARDIAVVTVVVATAVPGLPNTGVPNVASLIFFSATTIGVLAALLMLRSATRPK